MFWEENSIDIFQPGMVVKIKVDEFEDPVERQLIQQLWPDLTATVERIDFSNNRVILPSTAPTVSTGGASAVLRANPSYLEPVISQTASEKPLQDYDSTRGQWFVNEPDAPALDNKDLTQIFNTDLNLKDKQRPEKEIVDFKGRENLQLAFSSLKLAWEEDLISPQKVLELLDISTSENSNEHDAQRYIETIEIGETDAKKYFDPLTASIRDFSEVPEVSQFFSAEREIFNGGIVYDIIAIPSGTNEIIYLALGLGSSPVMASLKLSSPETYTDGDDFDQKKDEYDNRALQFRQEDSLSLVLPKDTLKGETDVTYFPSPKVYQDINENTGYADMAITADLRLSWQEEEFKLGDKVKLLEDWPLDQNGRNIIPAGTVGTINELPGAQFNWKSFRVQLGIEPWEIERVM